MYTKPHVSTFEGGLNTDVSNFKLPPNMYVDGKNIRIMTEEGLSSGSLVNELGNKKLFGLPDTVWPTYVTDIDDRGLVTINLQGTDFTDVPADSAEKAYDYLITHPDIVTAGLGTLFQLFYNNKELIVQNLTNDVAPTIKTVPFSQRGTEQGSLNIISIGIAGDYIVVFTTNKDNNMQEPSGTYGQIWRLKYDKVQGEVEAGYLDGSDNLTLDKALVANRVFNFSTAIKIYFETYIKNDQIVKIYMYDGYNILRHLNIADPDALAIPLSGMDILSNVKFSYPVPVEIIDSGSLYNGKYRYAYQLYTADGNQTTYSPTSIGLDIYTGKYYNTEDLNTIGGSAEEPAYKSIRMRIENIDLAYERIRIVSIFYTSNTSLPVITVIKDLSIPDSAIVEFIDDGTGALGALTIEEYRTLGTELFIPSTAEVKDNMLIVADLVEKRFDFGTEDWDPRAYRFQVAETTTIESTSGLAQTIDVTAVGTDPMWDVDPKHDCIQDYAMQQLSKYASDGLTLGGEGPNISYEFIVGPELILMDSVIRGQLNVSYPCDEDNENSWEAQIYNDYGKPKQVRFNSIPDDNPTYDFNGIQYNNFSYANYASPIISALFTGYAKNEMYRFAIELFDKKGKRCFANWIADIRFPDLGTMINKDWTGAAIAGGYKLVNSSSQYSNLLGDDDDLAPGSSADSFDQVTVRPLGIRFSLKNIPLDEDGNPYSYRIVRAERPDIDKRMLMQGPLLDIEASSVPGGIPSDPYHRPVITNMFNPNIRGNYMPLGDPTVAHEGYNRYGNYASLLGKTNDDWASSGTWDNLRDIPQNTPHMFISPEVYFLRNYTVPQNTTFVPIGLGQVQLRDIVDSYEIDDIFVHNGGPDAANNYAFSTGFPMFYWGRSDQGGWLENVDENKYTVLDAVIVPSPTPDFQLGTAVYTVNNWIRYRNVLFTVQQEEYQKESFPFKESARAGTRLIVDFDRVFEDTDLLIPDAPGSSIFNYKVLTTYVIGRLENSLLNQYGGNSFSDRSRTVYTPAGPIIHGDELTDVTVFEGDTFINVFDYLNVQMSWRNDGDHGLGIMETQWFILESTINVDVRSGISYNDTVKLSSPSDNGDHQDYRGNFNIQELGGGTYGITNINLGQYIQNFDSNAYNTAYIAPNNAAISIPQPSNYDPNTIFYSRIRRSQDKIYGDVYDRWLVFLPDNYKDVNTDYGRITNLMEFSNKLFFFQERSVGIIGINEMALSQTDQAGATLLLGKADVMDQYIYTDNNHGVAIHNSVYSIPQGIIAYDSNNLKLFITGGQGVTELSVKLGIQTLLKDNTLFDTIGFYGVYDSYNNRSYNMLSGVGYKTADPTVYAELPADKQYRYLNFSYNTALGIFESTYDFTPRNMIVYKGDLMSTNPNNESVWIHGQTPHCNYYGTQFDWHITSIVNIDSAFNKMLTNFEINNDSDLPPKEIRVGLFPSYDLYHTQTDFKKRLNTWRCMAPRHSSNEKDRLRGHTFMVTLEGSDTERVVTHNILSYTMTNIQ